MLTTVQKSIKIGNSWGTIIPTQFWKELGVEPGSELIFQAANRRLVVSGEDSQISSVTPEFLQSLERMHKRYGTFFRELAKK